MCKNRNNPRAGIALVMVLGVLSLMILMAVSFAISMRTERVAAGNYADTVRARQLAQAALARAMDDILFLCGSNVLDPYYLPYPDWTVTNSWTSEQSSVAANLLKGSASNFVPRALWAAAAATTNPLLASNYWLTISSVTGTEADTNLTTNVVGRVAYMILNCSGLLDANFAGGTNRGVGANPVELAFTNLPEMPGSLGKQFLDNRRTNFFRFETQAELNELAGYTATNLSVFSHAPAGFLSNATIPFIGTQVNLAGEFSNLVGRMAPIANAFVQYGFTPEQAGCLFTNLINYVDAGREPVDITTNVHLNSPATKPVPMINEIVFSNQISKLVDVPGPGTNTYEFHNSKLLVEFWLPFIRPYAGNYDVKISGNLRAMSSFSSDFSPEPIIGQVTPTPKSLQVLEFNTTNVLSIVTNADYSEIVMSVDNLNIRIYRPAGANPSEDVDIFSNLTFSISVTNTLVPNATNAAYASIECVDPRFNHDINQWTWTDNPSLYKTNHCTTTFWANHSGCDTNTIMHVACAPVQSVGELGYLAYAPWRTVKLYGSDAHPVLDYFAMGTNTTDSFVTSNTIWRGRVNPNTINREVLATAFVEMPIDEYPWQTVVGLTNITWDQALLTADFIYDHGPYTNLSDLYRQDWATHFNDVYPTHADNELKREAFIRNTVGLFNTRGQVFTILIEAHVASGGNIPRRPSRQRAVAVVWRDAWTGEMFVRYLKWLKD